MRFKFLGLVEECKPNHRVTLLVVFISLLVPGTAASFNLRFISGSIIDRS